MHLGHAKDEVDHCLHEKSIPYQMPNKDWVIPFSVAMVIKKVEDKVDDGVCDPMSKKVTCTMIFRFKLTGLKNLE